FDTPLWFDDVKRQLRAFKTGEEKVAVAKARKEALEAELRDVSIRVNLFEKIIIPRTQANIKKIKVFLGDQQLAAVAQAKIAKRKIAAKRGVA
ncbi:MAG: V-type ATP synthase subunit D, partial [Simkaniaceae bacterium]|nr:V-type ATP synthase subunit D [Simkaniaceae bacterium]